MNSILKNGVLSKSAMTRASSLVKYDVLIAKLNRMWNDKSYFDICSVTESASSLGRNLTHTGYKYEYLRPYHVMAWGQIAQEDREEIAAVIVSYLNNSRIGYDRTEQLFVDTLTVPESDNIFTKYSVSKFYQRLTKLKGFFRKLLNLFKKKKA